jgi:hypothetical protein
MENHNDWMCAQCLRTILTGHVRVHPDQAASFPLYSDGLHNMLLKYGVRSLRTTMNQRVPLYAVTMVNNEYRCGIHLDK